MIESSLMVYLRAQLGHNRVHVITAPENETPPYVVLDLDNSLHDRYLNRAIGLKEYDFEISCYSDDAFEAVQTARSIISILEPFSGKLVSAESPTVTHTIAGVEITSQAQIFDYNADLFRHSVFAIVKFL